jgi:hypothetical protein
MVGHRAQHLRRARRRAAAILLPILALTLGVAPAAPPAQAQPAPTTLTFEYTGAAQSWTVPAGVTQATFDVFGASGGRWGSQSSQGLGGRATARLVVTPGDTIAIVVGEHGRLIPKELNRRTFNGGGAGGIFLTGDGNSGGSGGGASDVRIGGTGVEHRVLVAGGGGGRSFDSPLFCHSFSGEGGGLVGGTAGCDGGTGGNQDGTSGSGQLGFGSNGGEPGHIFENCGGGGGGGGYYGGAGGAACHSGGGGSGFGPGGTVFETGVRDGNGRVIITYTVRPPTLTRIDLGAGPETGGTRITLTGSDFVPGQTTVTFGAAQATEVACASTTRCAATTPPGTGTVPVRVSVGDGLTSTQDIRFSYAPPPTLTSVSPNQGPAAGGVSVTLTGENFVLGQTYATFGAAPLVGASCASSTTCYATSPPGTGTVQVTITTPFGTSNGVPFTYSAAPGGG